MSAAEDDLAAGLDSVKVSSVLGPAADTVCDGEDVLPKGEAEDHVSAASDSGSLCSDGSLASWCRWVNDCVPLASTSLVWGDRIEKAEGTEVGVDDHSVKFPETGESSVCVCGSACCVVGCMLFATGVG